MSAEVNDKTRKAKNNGYIRTVHRNLNIDDALQRLSLIQRVQPT